MATTKKGTKAMNGAQARLFDTRNDLEAEVRTQMITLLNAQLADTFHLFSQTKQAHWNVKGKDFYQLHEMYDLFAGNLLGFVDLIAERATALGGLALGTVQMAANATRLSDFPQEATKGMDTVQTLAERFANLAESTREAISTADEAGDQDTADLFTEVSRELDKMLWFLEAHLQE